MFSCPLRGFLRLLRCRNCPLAKTSKATDQKRDSGPASLFQYQHATGEFGLSILFHRSIQMPDLSIRQSIPFTAKLQLLFAATCLLLFASLPWISFFRSDVETASLVPFVIISAWSSCPVGLALVLVGYVTRKVTFTVRRGVLYQESQFLFHRTTKLIPMERAYLALHKRHGYRRTDIHLSVFVRNGRRLLILASEQYFSRVEDLFTLIKTNTSAKCLDLRATMVGRFS